MILIFILQLSFWFMNSHTHTRAATLAMVLCQILHCPWFQRSKILPGILLSIHKPGPLSCPMSACEYVHLKLGHVSPTILFKLGSLSALQQAWIWFLIFEILTIEADGLVSYWVKS